MTMDKRTRQAIINLSEERDKLKIEIEQHAEQYRAVVVREALAAQKYRVAIAQMLESLKEIEEELNSIFEDRPIGSLPDPILGGMILRARAAITKAQSI